MQTLVPLATYRVEDGELVVLRLPVVGEGQSSEWLGRALREIIDALPTASVMIVCCGPRAGDEATRNLLRSALAHGLTRGVVVRVDLTDGDEGRRP